jgi:hypothetical protein
VRQLQLSIIPKTFADRLTAAPAGSRAAAEVEGATRSSGRRSHDTVNPAFRYNVARIIFAAILLLAAGLKFYSLLPSPLNLGRGLERSEWDRIGILLSVAVESLIAGWLLTGRAQRWARRAAMTLLTVFIAIASWHLFEGSGDCGCFGPVRMHPAWALALDCLCLGLLYWLGRDMSRSEPRSSPSSAYQGAKPVDPLQSIFRQALPFVLSLFLAGTVVGGFRLISGRPLSSFFHPQLLSTELGPEFSGFARQGEVVQARFIVRNVSGESVRLLGAASSCGCTVVTNEFPIELAPGGATVVPVKMTVGRPDRNGRFSNSAILFTNREGMVPPLTIEVTVDGPN